MLRRIGLVGAVIAASSLAVGVAESSAKSHHKKPAPPAPTTQALKSTCKLAMSVAVPAGATGVLADPSSGTMYGSMKCSGAGAGVVSFPFNVADSGDTVGNMTGYTGLGSITGAVDLSQTSSAPPTPYVFGNAAFNGTFKIKSGTGAYKGVKGSGTFTSCTTPDSIHYSCTLKLKGTIPAAS